MSEYVSLEPLGPHFVGDVLTDLWPSPPVLYVLVHMGIISGAGGVCQRAQPAPKVGVNIVTSTLTSKTVTHITGRNENHEATAYTYK